MSWISEIFSSSVGEVISSVGDVIDSVHTSEEEKIRLRNALALAEDNAKLKEQEIENRYQEEITKRWISDNQGNFITKSARPLVMWYLTISVTVLAVVDSGIIEGFDMKEAWISLFTVAFITVLGAYFGSKGLERIKNKVVG